MLTCKQASQLISQSLDHPLSWYELMQLRLHLMMCGACNRFKKQLNVLLIGLRKIRSNIENNSAIQLPLDAKTRIVEKLKSNQHSQ
ncbi:zf-HC2 domain-containing protein [Methylotenera sp.]|uniref:zf-HC2 domain-containing protein n=1 Tax=Methylotenera sp. TaxID=2051956 RepID=UPI002735F6DF|nr:zf-HC2 domain-containing protein [Methylotenera sp.]MDP3210230.1 zf-HC2 domain-containing protein [Methylotenera sp.]